MRWCVLYVFTYMFAHRLSVRFDALLRSMHARMQSTSEQLLAVAESLTEREGEADGETYGEGKQAERKSIERVLYAIEALPRTHTQSHRERGGKGDTERGQKRQGERDAEKHEQLMLRLETLHGKYERLKQKARHMNKAGLDLQVCVFVCVYVCVCV
jgi:hypothetical protein